MNSMLRQTHIKANDLSGFLWNYDSSNTTAVSIWAKTVSSEFKPGTLIFILEPINLPFGLISFVRKEDEENFRVSDFALVVRLEDGKPMVVTANNNNYELRFLETLIEERARKAVIDRKKFSFVAARPAASLVGTALKELERLAGLYASGGSRRSFMNEAAQLSQEPTMSLLAACGAHMHNSGDANKQPLDIALICSSLYASDNKQPDNNRTQLKSTFIPLPGDIVKETKSIPSSTNKTDSSANARLTESSTDEQNAQQKPRAQDATGFNLMQSWGGEKSKGRAISPLNSHFGEDLTKGQKPTVSDQSAWSSNAPSLNQSVPQAWANVVPKIDNDESKSTQLDGWINLTPKQNEQVQEDITKEAESNIANPEAVDSTVKNNEDEEVYRHLTEAITGLLGPSTDVVKPNETASGNSLTNLKPASGDPPAVLNQDKPQIKLDADKITTGTEHKSEHNSDKRRWPAAKSFEKLPAFSNPLMPQNTNQPTPPQEVVPSPKATKSAPLLEPVLPLPEAIAETITIEQSPSGYKSELPLEHAEPKITSEQNLSSTISEDYSEPASSVAELSPVADQIDANEQIEQADIFSIPDVDSEMLDDFQEPKVVMNEMASLMSKLETQVARASKKLAIKTSEIEQRLSANMDALLNLVIQEDKDAYAELLVRSDALIKEFELLFDKLKTELAEKAALGREKIKGALSQNQDKIQDGGKSLRAVLLEEFKEYQTQFEQLVESQEKSLDKLIAQENSTLHERLEAIDRLLEDTSTKLDSKLANYFDNFKENIEEKVTTLSKSFNDQIEILGKNIESSCAENIEKLKLSKNDFFNSLDRLVKVTEIALSRQVRAAQTEFFLPRLKERKQIIEAMMQDMRQTFAERSFAQAKAQSEGAENSLVLARQQLKELVEERLARLDVVGRNQQAGLEDIFRSAANPLEQQTSTVMQLLKQAEQEINECEEICNKLAEAYNLDSDPSLTAVRQDVYAKVEASKAKLRAELESLLDGDCHRLENTAKNFQGTLNNKRTELVQQVRTVSDKGLQTIRQAIHDAYNDVQIQREKYME